MGSLRRTEETQGAKIKAAGVVMYKIGDHSRAIWSFCKEICTTTMDVRDLSVRNHPEIIVHNVLVAVCDQCGNIVGIPHQTKKEGK